MGVLDEKVALVTGASRGLGAGIARAFAREGAAVAVNYNACSDKANAIVAEIEAAGGRAIAVQADCTDEAQVDRLVRSVEDALGAPRIVVNNAGTISQNRLVDMPAAEWDDVLAAHLRSHFLVSRACLPAMSAMEPVNGERRSAKIINMSSGIGQKGGRGGAGIVHYVTAKAGVLGFTKGLAGELAPMITVNAIAPGVHPTDMTSGLTEDWSDAKQGDLLLGIGTVDDVADTAVFIASPSGDYYTGQVFTPNGGDVMNG